VDLSLSVGSRRRGLFVWKRGIFHTIPYRINIGIADSNIESQWISIAQATNGIKT
jgi:hypothetical protein